MPLEIADLRLNNQILVGRPLAKVEDAVAWFGAVQAQDFTGAKWGLAQRLRTPTNEQVDAEFDEGRILRTHVLRPTWHFVLPTDIRWMLSLTAPRVRALMAHYDHALELDDATYLKANRIIAKALGDFGHRTRTELGEVLTAHGVAAKGQRLGHIAMRAELDAVVCSGPLRGKQFTYALLDERAPRTQTRGRDAALVELAQRYFQSHGPATAQDFAWWSGLTVADARTALEELSPSLESEMVGRTRYWFTSRPRAPHFDRGIHLLPNYDEYVISYRDYAPIFAGQVKALNKPFGNALLAHIAIRDGLVIGQWKRMIEKQRLVIGAQILVPLGSDDRSMLEAEAARYGRFLGVPATVNYA